MSIFSKQTVFCRVCATKMFVRLSAPGRSDTCSTECKEELSWRETLSTLGKDYYPYPGNKGHATGGGPTCDSPQPRLHPAMQNEGEVQVCKDPYHGEDINSCVMEHSYECDCGRI